MLLFPRWILINGFPNQINVNQTLQCPINIQLVAYYHNVYFVLLSNSHHFCFSFKKIHVLMLKNSMVSKYRNLFHLTKTWNKYSIGIIPTNLYFFCLKMISWRDIQIFEEKQLKKHPINSSSFNNRFSTGNNNDRKISVTFCQN